jgi:DNA-binding beta-propeller fold protein YncE
VSLLDLNGPPAQARPIDSSTWYSHFLSSTIPQLPLVEAINLGLADVPSPSKQAGSSYFTPEESTYLMPIQRFSGPESSLIEYARGQVLVQWDRSGSGPGQFHEPTGIAVDRHGNVYVADTGNNRIQKLIGSGDPR